MNQNLKKPLIILAGIILFIFVIFLYRNVIAVPYRTQCGIYTEKSISIDRVAIQALIADDYCKKTLGLSGKNDLDAYEGMLFLFNTSGTYPFWMKDMKFPLDIIWISSDFSVVGIEKSLSPDTYPEIFGKNYTAQYVLELPAGFADANDIKVGDRVSFL
jgi:uncharacterized membrane protein (UPF0127 family)